MSEQISAWLSFLSDCMYDRNNIFGAVINIPLQYQTMAVIVLFFGYYLMCSLIFAFPGLFRSVPLFCCSCCCIVAWSGVPWSLFLFVFLLLYFLLCLVFTFCCCCFCVEVSLWCVSPHYCLLWCHSCLDVWFTAPSSQPTLLLVLAIPLYSPSHTRTLHMHYCRRCLVVSYIQNALSCLTGHVCAYKQ